MANVEISPRQQLLEAAEARFRRFGFRHSSVEAITRAAGTGKGSLYLHYRSKEELYLDVVARAVDNFVDEATSRMRSSDIAPARLSTLVQAAIDHYGQDDLLRASLIGDDDLVNRPLAEHAGNLQRARITELIEQTLRDGQAEGTIRPDLDPAPAAIILFETGWAIVHRHIEGRLQLPLPQALATLNEIIGRGTIHTTRPETDRPRPDHSGEHRND